MRTVRGAYRTHGTKLLPLLGLMVTGVLGCSDSTVGSAEPQPDSTSGQETRSSTTPDTSTSPPASPLADVNPCTLFPPDAAREFGLAKEKENDIAGSRGCKYLAEDGRRITVVIFDDLGLSEVQASSEITPIDIGGERKAVESLGAGNTVCAVTMAVTESSRVDIQGSDRSGDGRAGCPIARKVARIVEPKLP